MSMRYVTILADLDSVCVKAVPEELYQRIKEFVNPDNHGWSNFQKLYDELCEDEPDSVAEQLWRELKACNSLHADLIQEY